MNCLCLSLDDSDKQKLKVDDETKSLVVWILNETWYTQRDGRDLLLSFFLYFVIFLHRVKEGMKQVTDL